MFAVCVALMGLLLRSPFGRTLIAIRENERRARFLGIPIERHIWLSFTISMLLHRALPARCMRCSTTSPIRGTLYYVISGDIVIMAVMGGMRSFWGPLIGAAVFVVLQDYHLLDDGELDELDRPGVRARGAVLPARHPGHDPPADGSMSLLEVRNVSKTFGSLVAVNDVSLSRGAGELRAIIGPNGAGKTTFFNLITGFFPPSSGRSCWTAATSPAPPRSSAWRWAWRAPSR